jgi:hypothetical protein
MRRWREWEFVDRLLLIVTAATILILAGLLIAMRLNDSSP